jgi:hypothetical protein
MNMTLLATTMESQQGVRSATPLLWSGLLMNEEIDSMTEHMATPFSQWAAHVQSLLAATQDRAATLRWVRKVEKLRAGFAKSRQSQQRYGVEPEQPTPEDREFDLWVDYCDEPAKYGEVWERWMEIDEKLLSGSKRWRRSAYWLKRQAVDDATEEEFRRYAAAARIQAAVRGHQVRRNTAWRDCCMCLAHTVSPLRTEKGYMCRDCGDEGPYVSVVEHDAVDSDDWNWHRAAYVDETIR